MRKILIILVLALAALPALAEEYEINISNKHARFAIVLPEGWRRTSSTGAEIYFGTKANADLAAAVSLIAASTPLADLYVAKHIDLSNRVVTWDTMVQQAGFPARRIEGTAVSEGEKLSFSSIAIKPTTDATTIQLSVWGPPNLWQRPDIKRQVEAILSSLKPLRTP